MRCQSFSVEKRTGEDRSFSSIRRLLWILLACCIQMTYIPTSNRLEGGIEPKLPIDIFPVSAVWVLPYILCYILWAASFAWILFKAEEHAFRSFIAACLLTFSLGALTFVLLPTYVPAAVLEGNDPFTGILRAIHEQWGRYSALPSGHVYITSLLVLFFGRWYPRSKPVWLVVLIVVSLSTLFTAQHYILDVLGGYLVALAGYHFGLWWTGFHPIQKRTSKGSGKSIPSSSLN